MFGLSNKEIDNATDYDVIVASNKADQAVAKGQRKVIADYNNSVSGANAAADKLVASGVVTYGDSFTDSEGNVVKSVEYFKDNVGGSEESSANGSNTKNKKNTNNASETFTNGQSEGGIGYTASPSMNDLRAEQEAEKKSYVARHKPTASTKTEDGWDRSVFGRMVRYTDGKGNVVKWGEIDENGNEVESSGPSSAAKQADMDKRAEAVKNGASISSAMSDESKSFMDAARWNSVVAAQRKAASDKIKGDYKQAADEIEKIKQARLAQKRDQRIAASYALGAAANGLKEPLQRDESGKISDPRVKENVDSNGVKHYYVTSYLGGEELAAANSKRRAAGDRNEYDSIIARYEIDQNGNKIGEVEFGIKDRVGGNAGNEKKMRILDSAKVARLLQNDLVAASGMSKEDAQHQIVNGVLGGISNPYGWKTNQETVLQNAQMQKNFDQGNNLSTNLGNKESVALDANANKNNDDQGRMRAISSVISSALRAGGVAMTPDQMAAVTSKVMGLFGYGNNSSAGSNGEGVKTGVDEMLDKIKQRKQGGGSVTGTVTPKKDVAKADGKGSSNPPNAEEKKSEVKKTANKTTTTSSSVITTEDNTGKRNGYSYEKGSEAYLIEKYGKKHPQINNMRRTESHEAWINRLRKIDEEGDKPSLDEMASSWWGRFGESVKQGAANAFREKNAKVAKR